MKRNVEICWLACSKERWMEATNPSNLLCKPSNLLSENSFFYKIRVFSPRKLFQKKYKNIYKKSFSYKIRVFSIAKVFSIDIQKFFLCVFFCIDPLEKGGIKKHLSSKSSFLASTSRFFA